MLSKIACIKISLFFWVIATTTLGQTYSGDSLIVRAILDSNGLDSIPVDEVVQINDNRVVVLFLKRIDSIPSIIGQLDCLEKLQLVYARNKELPGTICNLMKLKEIVATAGDLEHLPDSIGNLVALVRLELRGNRVVDLPESIGGLTNLKELVLRGNLITSLPESFGRLVNLGILNMYRTKLESLPQSFGNLVNLVELDLYDNNLKDLPDSIINLQKLNYLDINGNRLCSLSVELENWADKYNRGSWQMSQDCAFKIDSTKLEQLYGSWDWVSSSGGFVGRTITPQTEGYTKSLTITPDSVFVFKNDTLSSAMPLWVYYTYSIYTGNYELAIGGLGLFEITDNGLYLMDNCYDCYGHRYEKNDMRVMQGDIGSNQVGNVFIFPNPFIKSININLTVNEDAILRVFDKAGKLVWESGRGNVIWDGRDKRGNVVPIGFYYLQVDSIGGKKAVKKIIKVK